MNWNANETLSVTGHRPHKLFGYSKMTKGNQRIIANVRKEIIRHIEEYNVNTFISGMALGIDMWFTEQVIWVRDNLYPHIKLIAAIPFEGQEKKWNDVDKETYFNLLDQCDKVHYVFRGIYKPHKMLRRDEWMVNSSMYQLAVWNGDTNGGTYHTYSYAKKKGKEITIIDPYNLGGK